MLRGRVRYNSLREGPLLTGLPSAVHQLNIGAWSFTAILDIDALTRQHAGDSGIGVNRPLLVLVAGGLVASVTGEQPTELL